MRSDKSGKSENRIPYMGNNTGNRKMKHTAKKVMLTDLKNTKNLFLISQAMHQNKNIPCVRKF